MILPERAIRESHLRYALSKIVLRSCSHPRISTISVLFLSLLIATKSVAY